LFLAVNIIFDAIQFADRADIPIYHVEVSFNIWIRFDFQEQRKSPVSVVNFYFTMFLTKRDMQKKLGD
jgi:hypothetical protein